MTVVLMHRTVTDHDAIGNDIEAMSEIFSRYCTCVVFAENRFNKRLNYIEEPALRQLIKSKEIIVVYHHSIYWQKGEELIKAHKGKLIFRYHNITPPAFFAPYNADYEATCRNGREQTKHFIKDFPSAFWLCDSIYNSFDLEGVAPYRIDVCPPFHIIESWAATPPDERILSSLLFNGRINLLSVGRVAPNKGHVFMLNVLRSLRDDFGCNAKLWLIGKEDGGIGKYNRLIAETVARYNLHEQYQLVGELSDSIMSAYYLGCDYYLCASEHEGFCVPLIESQYFMLPVLARNSSAIPETLGEQQIVIGDDPKKWAETISALNCNTMRRDTIRRTGRNNYNSRFSFVRIEERFCTVLNKWNVLRTG